MQQDFLFLIDKYGEKFSLTKREMEIIHLLAKKVVLPEKIASELNISVNTVNNHLKKLFHKTKTDNKAELLASMILYIKENKTKQKSPRVLIIDDESDFCDVLSNYLQSVGVETHCCYSSIAAVEESKKISVDVILSDIRMPSMNGVQLLQELRKAHYYEPGVIFISGYAEDYNLDDLLDKGAIGFFEKPADLGKLHRMILDYTGLSLPASTVEDKKVSYRVEKEITLNKSNIGFGGFFLPADAMDSIHKTASLKNGDLISVDFQVGTSLKKHNSVCEIAWIRLQKNKKQGIGLKFLTLAAETKKEIIAYVRSNKILSYIPSCSESLT